MLVLNAELVVSHGLISVHSGGRLAQATCSHGRLSRWAWCDWQHGLAESIAVSVATTMEVK